MSSRKYGALRHVAFLKDILFDRITTVGNVNVLDEFICFSSIRFPGMHYGLGICLQHVWYIYVDVFHFKMICEEVTARSTEGPYEFFRFFSVGAQCSYFFFLSLMHRVVHHFGRWVYALFFFRFLKNHLKIIIFTVYYCSFFKMV